MTHLVFWAIKIGVTIACALGALSLAWLGLAALVAYFHAIHAVGRLVPDGDFRNLSSTEFTQHLIGVNVLFLMYAASLTAIYFVTTLLS